MMEYKKDNNQIDKLGVLSYLIKWKRQRHIALTLLISVAETKWLNTLRLLISYFIHSLWYASSG